jgi:hypothetical protein
MQQAMVIDGKRYIEVEPVEPQHPVHGVCGECALGGIGKLKQCAAAVMGDAEKAFGGDCETRDVIYVEVSA